MTQSDPRAAQDGPKPILKSDLFDVEFRLQFRVVLGPILGAIWGAFWLRPPHLVAACCTSNDLRRPMATQDDPKTTQDTPKTLQKPP